MSTAQSFPRLVFAVGVLLVGAPFSTHADIFRWDTGELIPGTAEIEPGPDVQLDHMELAFAALRAEDLSGATFASSNLTDARLSRSTLTRANLTGANLTDASLSNSTLTDANFTGAIVTGASFQSTTSRGFTKQQLYSTASYQIKNLQGIILGGNDLTDWDFSGQDLTNAGLGGPDVDLTGAVVIGASLWAITREQLYSTASYQERNLQGIDLGGNDLNGWDLSGQNLTAASLSGTGADLSGAVVMGAHLGAITREQLYSTASHQNRNLQGITLGGDDLAGWDFSGQNLSNAGLGGLGVNLTGADFSGADLTSADLSRTTLTDTDLTGAVVRRGDFSATTSQGFTENQFYSTASYRQGDLQGVDLGQNDLAGWDFRGQHLANADFFEATLTGANLTGANLKNASLRDAVNLPSATFSAETLYNQWTVFPGGFDPAAAGLTLMPSPTGDFNASDGLEAADLDMLAGMIRLGFFLIGWPYAMFNVNPDFAIDEGDHRVWVKDLKHTWYGDANLDGNFDSSDMVQVFVAGTYEKEAIVHVSGEILNPVSWVEGDWNGDGVFDSGDLIAAFVDGGYEKGQRTDVAVVPEPGGWILLLLAASALLTARR